jgi:cyclic pyranopterin phosphate synthase
MPEDGWTPSQRDALLNFEELFKVIQIMVHLGVNRIRFTGGEPLIRKDLIHLIQKVSGLDGVRQIALTTNGHILDRLASDLYTSGVRRLNVSLDTFDPLLFKKVTRGGDIHQVLKGIKKAQEVGLTDIVLNAVLSSTLPNHPQRWIDECKHAWEHGLTIRWIEEMPMGGDSVHSSDPQFSRPTRQIVHQALSKEFILDPLESTSSFFGPAKYWKVREGPYQGALVGFIDPMSDDGFCSTCNRVRLTAQGGLRACLADDSEVDLRSPLRAGLHGPALIPFIEEAFYGKRPKHLMNSFSPSSIMTGIGG